MEPVFVFLMLLLAVLVFGAGFVGVIMAGVALNRVGELRRELGRLRGELERLRGGEQVPPGGILAGRGAGPGVPGVAERPSRAVVPETIVARPDVVRPPEAVPVRPVEAVRPPAVTVPAVGAPAVVAGGVSPMQGGPGATHSADAAWVKAMARVQETGLRDFESKVGQKWIAWVGAVVVFISAVFFLKHAFDNDWIGPTGQVVISAVLAAGMAATGSYFVGKGWRILGQSLMGLGISVLYATFYAAFQVYHPPVMSQNLAFGAMILVTAAGMTLAVMHDAITLAFLAVLGGILTPVLVSTGQDSRDVLFTYMLVLDLGVIGVAFFRGWRALDTLAMAGTFAMYAGWYGKFYTPDGMGPALAWLGAFYVVFLVLPFVYHLVKKTPVTLERFVMAIVNAAVCGGYAWYTLREEYLFTMGFVSLGMAAAYLVVGVLIQKRVPQDATSLFGAIAMAVTFLTLAVPMQLQAQGIMLAWVAEAPVLVYLGYRYRYLPVRVFGMVVLVIGVGRLLIYHWPEHAGLFEPFVNKAFLSAMAVPVAAGVLAVVHMWQKGEKQDRVMQFVAACAGGLLAVVLVQHEAGLWFEREGSSYAGGNVRVLIWTLGAVAFLGGGWWSKRGAEAGWVWGVGMFAMMVGAVLMVRQYSEEMPAVHTLMINARFLVGLLLAGVIFGFARVVHERATGAESPERVFGVIFLLGGIVGLLFLLSAEVYTFCVDHAEDVVMAQRAGQMSITLVWSLYAATMLVIGFWRKWRALRLGGLALFGIAALKLAVVDLGFLKDIYRIVSFLVLGLMMLAASYLYHKLEKRLETALGGPETEPGGVA